MVASLQVLGGRRGRIGQFFANSARLQRRIVQIVAGLSFLSSASAGVVAGTLTKGKPSSADSQSVAFTCSLHSNMNRCAICAECVLKSTVSAPAE